jgi:hypothetical protein
MEGILPSRRICLYWHRERRDDEGIKQFLAALEDTCGAPEAELAPIA